MTDRFGRHYIIGSEVDRARPLVYLQSWRRRRLIGRRRRRRQLLSVLFVLVLLTSVLLWLGA